MDSFLHKLYFSRLRITFAAVESLALPVFKGSAFRGCFGQALKQQVCRFRRTPCEQCRLKYDCSFSVLFNSFEKPDENNNEKTAGKMPHPYILSPFHDRRTKYEAGDTFGFELTLIGSANKFSTDVLNALTAMGDIGIGRDKQKFRAVKLEALNSDLEYDSLGYFSSAQLISSVNLPVFPVADKLIIELQTPLRLTKDSKPDFDIPDFFHFIEILTNRLMHLAILYCDADKSILTQKEQWLQSADKVVVEMPDREFAKQTRYSGTQKTEMKFDGITGTMHLKGNDLNLWIPLLTMGSWLHTGSTTTFGLGKYNLNFAEH